MPERDAAAPVEPRVSTGCPPLDTMLCGGLVAHRPYLIVGPSGTGKTTLALQFLCEGARRGEKCLLVTLEEPPNEMRVNHRSLAPDVEQVFVFDAIPDVMRYERAPFKDIAAVRQSVPFGQVPLAIRKTPELASVEVTFTALEQTIKMEMVRQNYSRLVIDSLTALQYFCMKGFDESQGAQSFLRFLSDLRVTSVLTVEAALEDFESPERLLARGEIRLFRWEHDARTVRALGVEKFRGSEHDVRLHPYRISGKGIDINLDLTISRDTHEVRSDLEEAPVRGPVEPPEPPDVFATSLAALEQDSLDLIALGVDVAPVRAVVLEAIGASERSTGDEVTRILARARGQVLEIVARLEGLPEPDAAAAPLRRLRARSASARAGIPPPSPLDISTLRPSLERILTTLAQPTAPVASTVAPAEAPGAVPLTAPVPPAPPSLAPSVPRAAPVVAVVPPAPPPPSPSLRGAPPAVVAQRAPAAKPSPTPAPPAGVPRARPPPAAPKAPPPPPTTSPAPSGAPLPTPPPMDARRSPPPLPNRPSPSTSAAPPPSPAPSTAPAAAPAAPLPTSPTPSAPVGSAPPASLAPPLPATAARTAGPDIPPSAAGLPPPAPVAKRARRTPAAAAAPRRRTSKPKEAVAASAPPTTESSVPPSPVPGESTAPVAPDSAPTPKPKRRAPRRKTTTPTTTVPTPGGEPSPPTEAPAPPPPSDPPPTAPGS
jgi:KaiC/GvpD/RAD55 family RecA-like ATPase